MSVAFCGTFQTISTHALYCLRKKSNKKVALAVVPPVVGVVGGGVRRVKRSLHVLKSLHEKKRFIFHEKAVSKNPFSITW